MRPNHVVGRNSPPYRVLVPARPSGAGLHRAAHRPPVTGVPVGGARLMLSISVLIAVPLLALNLRPAVTSVGAVLADIRMETGLSAVLASVVVAAPVWCFAVGGALAYKLRAAWGTSRTVTLALVMLAATLATRVTAGPYLLLAGTVLACLSIAVLGTLLPVITHAAPTKAWALLTGCYVAAMGGGSGLGALITPQVSGGSTWQWGVSAWALLAAAALVAWRVATRRFTEPPVAAGPRPSPFTLRPPSTAWSTTIHFGLTSGFTFTIMGWLPSILLDHSHVDPATVGWMFGVAMALGVPIALLVPKWARAGQSQSALAIALCVPNLVAMGGLLLYPEITPWVWAVALGLGMPAVGLALTLISLRAAPDGDTAAALSSMVQGFGYAIAGATALGAGLLHSSTQGWEWPLIGLLVILCGQLITGMHAGLPTTVYSGRRFAPSVVRPEPRRVPRPAPAPPPSSPVPVPWELPVQGNGSGPRPFPQPRVPWQSSGPRPMPLSAPGIGWGPRGTPPPGSMSRPVERAPGDGSRPRRFPSPRPVAEPVPRTPSPESDAEPVREPVAEPVSRLAEAPVAEPVREPVAEPVSRLAEAPVAERVQEPVAEPVSRLAEAPVAEPVREPVAEPVSRLAEAPVAAPSPVPRPVSEPVAEPVSRLAEAPVREPVAGTAPDSQEGRDPVADRLARLAEALVVEPTSRAVETPAAEPAAQLTGETAAEPMSRSAQEPVALPAEESVAEPESRAGRASLAEQVSPSVEVPVEEAESLLECEPVAESASQPAEAPAGEPVAGLAEATLAEPESQAARAQVVRPVEVPVAEPQVVRESVAEPVSQLEEPVERVAEVPMSRTAGDLESVSPSAVESVGCVAELPRSAEDVEPPSRSAQESVAQALRESPIDAPSTHSMSRESEADEDGVRIVAPRQEALFDVPQQEALFEIPLPRRPLA